MSSSRWPGLETDDEIDDNFRKPILIQTFKMIKKSAFLTLLLQFAASATIAELIAANPRLSRVASAASQNPLWSAAGGRITVFAPTNEAINAASLPSGNVGVVTSRQVLLKSSRRSGSQVSLSNNLAVIPLVSSHFLNIRSGPGYFRNVSNCIYQQQCWFCLSHFS